MKNALLSFYTLVLGCAVAMAGVSATGELEVELRAAPYRMVETDRGVRIEMDGFDYLKEPGRPMLPEKSFLLMLPPGTRAVSLEVVNAVGTELPGMVNIAPAPSLIPLKGPLADNDRPRTRESYPTHNVRITARGGLRKYSYVQVSYVPFTYHPSTGKLFKYDSVRFNIKYEKKGPSPCLFDTVADERAAELFSNYAEMQGAYQAPAPDFEQYDYVIITTPENVGAVDGSTFPGYKASLGFSLRTVLTTDPEIAGQPGADLAEKIRTFLRANYATWGIRYLLLVGDYADVPMRYCYPDPDNHLHDPSDPGTGPGSVPTDHYYADLSLPDAESWDLDGDGFYGEYGEDAPDFLNEISVGRIPTSDDYSITYTLDKLVRYEDDTGDWKRHALHAGAVLFFENQDYEDIPFRDGAVTVAEIESGFMNGWSISRYSEREGMVSSTYEWPALTLQAFLTDWRNGTYGIVNWAGHGWPDQVARRIWVSDDGDGVPETDGSDDMRSEPFIRDRIPLEDDYPSILCAVSCDVGYPEPNPFGNIGINLLSDPMMGSAAGVVSSSRYAAVSRDWPALPGGAESLCYEFNRYMIAGPGHARLLGDALYDAKYFSHVNYGWEKNYEYRNMYNYNLYGDPAMDWRGAGDRTGNLLRSAETGSLDPVEDLYIAGFVAGDVDPESSNGSPLLMYGIDGPVHIWLELTPAGEVRIDF